MFLTQEQVEVFKANENQSLIDLKDVDQKNINYYTIERKDGGNIDGKPKQDAILITEAI